MDKGTKIEYRIFRKSETGWDIPLATGSVDAALNDFTWRSKRYQIDTSRLQHDSKGKEYLAYGENHFSPLIDRTTPIQAGEEGLEPRGSILAENAFSRKGWLNNMIMAATGKNKISWLAIMLMALAAVAGLSGGYSAGLLQHGIGGGTVTVGKAGNQTVTFFSQTPYTVLQQVGVPTTTTTTLQATTTFSTTILVTTVSTFSVTSSTTTISSVTTTTTRNATCTVTATNSTVTATCGG